MKKHIEVEVRRVYGNTTIYPVCECAQHFAAIAGTKTLTKSVIKHIKELGFTVKQVSNEVVL